MTDTTTDPLLGFDPSDIVVAPGGQTLARVTQPTSDSWPEIPASVSVVTNHPCLPGEYGWECASCGATSEHYHAPQLEAWRSAAAHRCPSGDPEEIEREQIAEDLARRSIVSTATITATATAVDDEIRIEVDAHNLSSAQYTALVTALARAGVGQPTSDAVIRKEIGSGVGWAFALRVRLDTTTIAQPAPATDTMIVGTGDAKAIPPGLAEELAGMAPENRAVAERVADLELIEPAPGWEQRAVDRAKREGVL